MKIDQIIDNISKSENVSSESLKDYIKSYEKFIKSEIKNYEDTSGLDDYKMNKNDYIILYELYNNTGVSPFKVHILLLYMYSYYKLDGINFNEDYFPKKHFFKFIKKNANMHGLILNIITSIKN